jgi:hypothetical protein
MRSAVSTLAPVALAAISLFTSPAAVVGQNRSAAESSRDVRREWSDLAKGRTEFEVSDPTLVPRQLVLAFEQSGCRHYEQLIEGAPIRFIVLRDRRFAIVLLSCGHGEQFASIVRSRGEFEPRKAKAGPTSFLRAARRFWNDTNARCNHVE